METEGITTWEEGAENVVTLFVHSLPHKREEGGGRREERKRCVILFGSLGSSLSKFSLFQGILPGNLTFRRL
jgi:hypothetical protein